MRVYRNWTVNEVCANGLFFQGVYQVRSERLVAQQEVNGHDSGIGQISLTAEIHRELLPILPQRNPQGTYKPAYLLFAVECVTLSDHGDSVGRFSLPQVFGNPALELLTINAPGSDGACAESQAQYCPPPCLR